MAVRTLRDLDVRGKRVLVRVDFNVPINPDGSIGDETRLRASLPTVRWLLDHGAACVILASHLGRPDGRPNPKFSLRPVADRFGRLLEEAVGFDDGHERVVLLENLRFDPGEEANSPDLARSLAERADVYVNDAFGTAHRAHASTAGVAALLPAAAGLLMEKELTALGGALESPRRPFVAIVGGSKISSKLAVVRNLLPRVDRLMIGGAMAFTLLEARGCRVGRSLVESEQRATALQILDAAGGKVMLPLDAVAAGTLEAGQATSVVDACAVPDHLMGLDIGPETIRVWAEAMRGSGTILWNGPLGAYETEPFARGTVEVARAVAESGATTIVGGGDLVAALESAGLAERMSHVSTGGGASLELLEGRVLPGVAALEAK